MQIQKQIGEGSFGKVYLAKWKETTVAVKILSNPNGSSDDDFPTRLPNPLLQSLEKVRPHHICSMLEGYNDKGSHSVLSVARQASSLEDTVWYAWTHQHRRMACSLSR